MTSNPTKVKYLGESRKIHQKWFPGGCREKTEVYSVSKEGPAGGHLRLWSHTVSCLTKYCVSSERATSP